MFENVISKANAANTKSGNRKATREMPRTQAFVQALVDIDHRITYAALADAAEQLGEHEPSGLSAGQRGAGLVKHLPLQLQPHVCRSNGSYKADTSWDTEVPGNLRQRNYVRPEAVGEFVQAFIAATDEEQSEEAPAEEPSIEEIETVE